MKHLVRMIPNVLSPLLVGLPRTPGLWLYVCVCGGGGSGGDGGCQWGAGVIGVICGAEGET